MPGIDSRSKLFFTCVCGQSFTAVLIYMDDMVITKNNKIAIGDLKDLGKIVIKTDLKFETRI